MVEKPVGQNEPQPQPRWFNGRAIARLFSMTLAVYLVVCIAEFIFVARVFGANAATALSLLSAIPLIVGVRMRLRWNTVNALDFVPLALVVMFTTWGSIAVVQSWYAAGLHLNPGTWTLVRTPSQEDLNWAEFGRALRKDPSFRELKIRFARGTYWVSGALESESELDRLIALANRCGINERRLDGPYIHSVSITIPGTTRAKRYDTSD